MYLRECNIYIFYTKGLRPHHSFKRKMIEYLINIIVQIKIKYT